jgi:hypothetical protein
MKWLRYQLSRWRYALSFIIPVPMSTTCVRSVSGADVQAGGHGNHFRDDDHHDLTSIKWVQWRHRYFRQRTESVCIG